MSSGMHLVEATNLLIRRHVYAKACRKELGESASESAREADTDESTDDGNMFDVLELSQLIRCRCPRPTWRMALVPGEAEYRCFECLKVHPDQSAEYELHIEPRSRNIGPKRRRLH